MFHEFHRGFFFKETYIWKEFCLTKPIFYLRGPILTNNFTIYLKKILILKKSKPNISKQLLMEKKHIKVFLAHREVNFEYRADFHQ